MAASDPSRAPEMSAATRGVLARVRRMVPPMLDKFHKGSSFFPRVSFGWFGNVFQVCGGEASLTTCRHPSAS